ncbi:hypothetical protein BCR37DRAFT_394642 [Protomyces lactucae-debilis]|uniref:Uncharacterized protein n=1 Tax=Protomyces lactucae-debilis TaxID=2754530 RepID=A0A1Y2F2N0_PROLT|nr:uncharacterized protein BCR37DRAFT_394642 [Protomyces lactucae-debilis]ORY78131.1 hypothetical protein BCR37DRAFT_394642 [Protomyces lactucae-debilis]
MNPSETAALNIWASRLSPFCYIHVMVRTLPWATQSSKVPAQAIKRKEAITVKPVGEKKPFEARFGDDDQYEMVVEDLEMIALELAKLKSAAEAPDDISRVASPPGVPSTDALEQLLATPSVPASLTKLKRRKPRAELEAPKEGEQDMACSNIILPAGRMASPPADLSVDLDKMAFKPDSKKEFFVPKKIPSNKIPSMLDLLQTSKPSPSIFNLSRPKKRQALEGQEAPPIKKLASAKDLYGF